MCGICGQIKIASDEPVDQPTIRQMTQTMVHRGPDDEGFYFDRSLGLGFRRLSIIDLAGGHQPMCDAHKSVWIVFNGEIYNYKELRAELESHGHVFQTSSDTEVIIYGYKQWGTNVFNHLNGMFGLAVWDVKLKRLVVARDAMGIKLIYYRLTKGELSFGSEIRPVLAAEDCRPQVDPTAFWAYTTMIDPDSSGFNFEYSSSGHPLLFWNDDGPLVNGHHLLANRSDIYHAQLAITYNTHEVPR